MLCMFPATRLSAPLKHPLRRRCCGLISLATCVTFRGLQPTTLHPHICFVRPFRLQLSFSSFFSFLAEPSSLASLNPFFSSLFFAARTPNTAVWSILGAPSCLTMGVL